MRFALSLACLLAATPLHAEEIRVAAASDLSFAMKEWPPLTSL